MNDSAITEAPMMEPTVSSLPVDPMDVVDAEAESALTSAETMRTEGVSSGSGQAQSSSSSGMILEDEAEDEIPEVPKHTHAYLRLMGTINGDQDFDQLITTDYADFTLGRDQSERDEAEAEDLKLMGDLAPQPQADVLLGSSNKISRLHARIRFSSSKGSYELWCLSKNGLYVDGLFLQEQNLPYVLHSRSLIQISQDCLFYVLFPRTSSQRIAELAETSNVFASLPKAFRKEPFAMMVSKNNPPVVFEGKRNVVYERPGEDRPWGKRWTAIERKAFLVAMLNWGAGSWEKIAKSITSAKCHRTVAEVSAYGHYFLSRLYTVLKRGGIEGKAFKELMMHCGTEIAYPAKLAPPSITHWALFERQTMTDAWAKKLILLNKFLLLVDQFGLQDLLKEVELPTSRTALTPTGWGHAQDVDLLRGIYMYGWSSKALESIRWDDTLCFKKLLKRTTASSTKQHAPTEQAPIDDAASANSGSSSSSSTSSTSNGSTITPANSNAGDQNSFSWPHVTSLGTRFSNLVDALQVKSQMHFGSPYYLKNVSSKSLKRSLDIPGKLPSSTKRARLDEKSAARESEEVAKVPEDKEAARMHNWKKKSRECFLRSLLLYGKQSHWDLFRKRYPKHSNRSDDALNDFYVKVTTIANQVLEGKAPVVLDIPMTESQASKIMGRLDFFNKLRTVVLPDPYIKEKLQCISPFKNSWYGGYLCDYELLKCVGEYGLVFDEIFTKSVFFAERISASMAKAKKPKFQHGVQVSKLLKRLELLIGDLDAMKDTFVPVSSVGHEVVP